MSNSANKFSKSDILNNSKGSLGRGANMKSGSENDESGVPVPVNSTNSSASVKKEMHLSQPTSPGPNRYSWGDILPNDPSRGPPETPNVLAPSPLAAVQAQDRSKNTGSPNGRPELEPHPTASYKGPKRGRKMYGPGPAGSTSTTKGSFSWSNILARSMGFGTTSTTSVASRQSALMPSFPAESDVSDANEKMEAKDKYQETAAAREMQKQGIPEPKRREDFQDEKLSGCCFGLF